MAATESRHGLVTATYGRRLAVRLDSGDTVDARIKGRRLRPVCGDRVTLAPLGNEPDWLVTQMLPRDNALTRPDSRGHTETLAANLDLLAAVCAPVPAPDWYLVDRYLCAAELMRIAAAVVYNKADGGDVAAPAAAELEDYRRLGYPAIACSAATGRRLDRLLAVLRGRTAIIVGQSGVGKSSLINALAHSEQRTADISGTGGKGRHTTVNSIMLPLPGGGAVVDSPGVRDYAPAVTEPATVASGFREIRALAARCRFTNCRHRREPGCAVKAAVEDGRIRARRYASYERMLALSERLAKRYF